MRRILDLSPQRGPQRTQSVESAAIRAVGQAPVLWITPRAVDAG